MCFFQFYHIRQKKTKFNTFTLAVSSIESRLTITVIGVPFIFRNTDTSVLTRSAYTGRLETK